MFCWLAEVQTPYLVQETRPIAPAHFVFPLSLVGLKRGDPCDVEVVGGVSRVDDARGAWRDEGQILLEGVAVLPVDTVDERMQ